MRSLKQGSKQSPSQMCSICPDVPSTACDQPLYKQPQSRHEPVGSLRCSEPVSEAKLNKTPDNDSHLKVDIALMEPILSLKSKLGSANKWNSIWLDLCNQGLFPSTLSGAFEAFSSFVYSELQESKIAQESSELHVEQPKCSSKASLMEMLTPRAHSHTTSGIFAHPFTGDRHLPAMGEGGKVRLGQMSLMKGGVSLNDAIGNTFVDAVGSARTTTRMSRSSLPSYLNGFDPVLQAAQALPQKDREKFPESSTAVLSNFTESSSFKTARGLFRSSSLHTREPAVLSAGNPINIGGSSHADIIVCHELLLKLLSQPTDHVRVQICINIHHCNAQKIWGTIVTTVPCSLKWAPIFCILSDSYSNSTFRIRAVAKESK